MNLLAFGIITAGLVLAVWAFTAYINRQNPGRKKRKAGNQKSKKKR